MKSKKTYNQLELVEKITPILSGDIVSIDKLGDLYLFYRDIDSIIEDILKFFYEYQLKPTKSPKGYTLVVPRRCWFLKSTPLYKAGMGNWFDNSLKPIKPNKSHMVKDFTGRIVN